MNANTQTAIYSELTWRRPAPAILCDVLPEDVQPGDVLLSDEYAVLGVVRTVDVHEPRMCDDGFVNPRVVVIALAGSGATYVLLSDAGGVSGCVDFVAVVRQ